jgi:arylsulfatase I/J
MPQLGAFRPVPQTQGGARCTWEDDMLAARLLDVIAKHNASQPLFLFWSAHTVHEPYEVPDADLARYAFVDVAVRRYYAAMLSHLDALVGTVEAALRARGFWENLLWVTTSDNGGPLAKGQPGSSLVGTSGSNNYPLRGGKIGNMEGGIRLNAFVSGGALPPARRGVVESGWMHLADFYATFCALAGVDPADARAAAAGLPPIDSLDLSAVLMGTNATSPRTEIAIGSSDDSDHAGNTLVVGVIDSAGWKLLLGNVDPAFFQGPVYPNISTAAAPEPHLKCGDPNDGSGPGCLFNVLDDPYELNDLAAAQPARVKALRARIAQLQAGAYNPVRGKSDKRMCAEGLATHKGFLGPWLP